MKLLQQHGVYTVSTRQPQVLFNVFFPVTRSFSSWLLATPLPGPRVVFLGQVGKKLTTNIHQRLEKETPNVESVWWCIVYKPILCPGDIRLNKPSGVLSHQNWCLIRGAYYKVEWSQVSTASVWDCFFCPGCSGDCFTQRIGIASLCAVVSGSQSPGWCKHLPARPGRPRWPKPPFSDHAVPVPNSGHWGYLHNLSGEYLEFGIYIYITSGYD